MGLIFDQEALSNGNIFKFEDRLQSHANRYIENGALLTTYYSVDQHNSTTDRGTKDIDQLFGGGSPLRYHKIEKFPLYGIQRAETNNTEENHIEDITIEGEGIIQPGTIVPNTYDLFVINHLKMTALFQVVDVLHDGVKQLGYYKIRYKLYSTNEETIKLLHDKITEKYITELNAIGSNTNPIIQKDDAIYRNQIRQMIEVMKSSYKAMYYNERHNCFLMFDQHTCLRWFDLCANEFIAKHSIMNTTNMGSGSIVLHDKLGTSNVPLLYNNSVYRWLEIDAPLRLLQSFRFELVQGLRYEYSSFNKWYDKDIYVMQPLNINDKAAHTVVYNFFNDSQYDAFCNSGIIPENEFDKLIWKYIHNTDTISIYDISLSLSDVLISSIDSPSVYLYTPLIIYIINKIMKMN